MAAVAPAVINLAVDFRTVLRNVVKLSGNQTNLLTNAEGVAEATDLLGVDEASLLSIFPKMGANKLNVMVKMPLRALREWTINIAQELAGSDDELEPLDFDDEVCARYQMDIALREKPGKDSGSGKTSISASLLNFSGKASDWLASKRKLLAYLGQLQGRTNVPLAYVLRDDDDRPDYVDDFTSKFWDAPLTGRSFESDNYMVLQILQGWTADGDTETYVDQFNAESDGRSAFLALKSNFEGDDSRQVLIQKVLSTIRGAQYYRDSEKFQFEHYCHKHLSSINDLIRCKHQVDPVTSITDFLNGITRPEYQSLKTYIFNDPVLSRNLQQAVTQFKKQMVQTYKYPADQRKQQDKNFRSIGSASGSNNKAGRSGNNSSNTGGNNSGRFGNRSYSDRGSGSGQFNRGRNNQSGNGGRGFGQNNNNRNQSHESTGEDNLYIPPNILRGLSPLQRAMIFCGRDDMRNNNSSNASQNTSQVPRNINATNTLEVHSAASTVVTQASATNNETAASSQFGRHSLGNNSNHTRNQSVFGSTNRRAVSRTSSTDRKATDYSGCYRLEADSRADIVCCGKGFVPVGDTEMVADVFGFHPDLDSIKDVPIRTCVTAYDHADGETIILEFRQALWFGDALDHSLLSQNKVRSFYHTVCHNPKQYTNGQSLHGIECRDDEVTFPFQMHVCISYLPIRTPTPDKIENCRHILMTSEDIWQPYSDNFAVAENVFSPHGKRGVPATSSKDHRSNVSPEILAQRWGTSVEIATKTLKITTQRGIRNILSPLSRRFRTRQTHLRYKYLNTDVFSDTLFSETKSARQFECAQLFVTDQDFAEVYPMQSKADAPYKLDIFCKTYGLPKLLVTDNAPKEALGEWEKVAKQYLLTQRTTEPYSGWQNRAELEIRELKKHFRRIMHRSRCPEAFWCYGLEYTKEIRKFTDRPNLDWRCPMEAMTGETLDCSEYLEFDFYGCVKFKDTMQGLADDVALGRWLGIAENVGQAMTYWILTSNGYVVARSTVQPITSKERRSPEEQKAQADFMAELTKNVGDFDGDLINTDDTGINDEMVEPQTNVEEGSEIGGDDHVTPTRDSKGIG